MFGGQAFNFGGERDPFCVRQGGGGEYTCRQGLGEFRRQLCVYWDTDRQFVGKYEHAISGVIQTGNIWGNTSRQCVGGKQLGRMPGGIQAGNIWGNTGSIFLEGGSGGNTGKQHVGKTGRQLLGE